MFNRKITNISDEKYKIPRSTVILKLKAHRNSNVHVTGLVVDSPIRDEEEIENMLLPSGEVIKKKRPIIHSSSSDEEEFFTEEEKSENTTGANIISFESSLPEKDDFVSVEYDGDYWPGRWLQVESEGAFIKCMAKCGKLWRWPEKEDCIFYAKNEIKLSVNAPNQVSTKRHPFSVPALSLLN
ncbi:unnamed protein product [Acanthoscelides obtectus]|uniref:Uncharacterized protein n=2 Tax=Acanthoscelides obtectus TaxID=200917 RepID=A0A9P0QED5_ACAOB|nr:unnamed protein product [Acanthoscelides obtectus]CAK1688293.1 hypothetical protein AOBTE_LOCUS36675 [Acanthoscelides obtectus]